MNRIYDIRTELESFVEYNRGILLRKELEKIAKESYVPKHKSEEYLIFMNNNECSFDKNHPQSKNHPYVWTMFSVVSQHVMGDCIEECFDKAMKG